jgi:hypothetical protein
MKKLFLLLLLAGFSSFASNEIKTITEKKEIKDLSVNENSYLYQKVAVKKMVSDSDICTNEANGDRNTVIMNGGSIDAANRAYHKAYFSCMLRRSRDTFQSL